MPNWSPVSAVENPRGVADRCLSTGFDRIREWVVWSLDSVGRPSDQEQKDRDDAEQREQLPHSHDVGRPARRGRIEDLVERGREQIRHEDEHDENPDGHLDTAVHHCVSHIVTSV